MFEMISPRLRIFADEGHYYSDARGHLNPIVKVLWNALSEEERIQIYGKWVTCFERASTIEGADIYLLTLYWKYYVERNRVQLAHEAAKRARLAGKRLVVMSEGDFIANLPFSNAVLFERSTYRSRRHQNGNLIFAMPAFISEYLSLYAGGKLQLRAKGSKPVIGFCGQADGNWLDFLRREAANRARWVSYRLGLRDWEPPPFEPTRFRRNILLRLAESNLVETNFLLRRRYRAGYWNPNKDPFHPTRIEFVQNILNTDYTVCIRGGGNFSQRFYETLCLGRIPIFIDTDCILPYDHLVDYSEFIVRIEPHEVPYIAEKVADFHASLSRQRFRDLQYECRRLWQEYLSSDGFYQNFHRHPIN